MDHKNGRYWFGIAVATLGTGLYVGFDAALIVLAMATGVPEAYHLLRGRRLARPLAVPLCASAAIMIVSRQGYAMSPEEAFASGFMLGWGTVLAGSSLAGYPYTLHFPHGERGRPFGMTERRYTLMWATLFWVGWALVMGGAASYAGALFALFALYAIFELSPATSPIPSPSDDGGARVLVEESLVWMMKLLNPAVVEGMDVTLEYVIDGAGVWSLRIRDAAVELHERSAPESDVRIMTDMETWKGIIANRMTGEDAFLEGRMRCEGDMELIMMLDMIFDRSRLADEALAGVERPAWLENEA